MVSGPNVTYTCNAGYAFDDLTTEKTVPCGCGRSVAAAGCHSKSHAVCFVYMGGCHSVLLPMLCGHRGMRRCLVSHAYHAMCCEGVRGGGHTKEV